MNKTRGRPNLGKTLTTRDRAVTVYLPTEEMVQEWKAEAGMRRIPLSRFVQEVVDDAIRRNLSGYIPREILEAELQQAKTDKMRLEEKVQSLETAIKQRDQTVSEYRAEREKVVNLKAFGVTLTEVADMISNVSEFYSNNESLPMDNAYDELGIRKGDASKRQALKATMALLIQNGQVEEGMAEWRRIGGGRRKGPRSAKK
jgi:hypothetical protein